MILFTKPIPFELSARKKLALSVRKSIRPTISSKAVYGRGPKFGTYSDGGFRTFCY